MLLYIWFSVHLHIKQAGNRVKGLRAANVNQQMLGVSFLKRTVTLAHTVGRGL